MINKILIFSLLGAISLAASGQSFIVLEKMGTKKRYEFHQGEKMEVKLNQDNFFTRINLLGLGDSIISTENQDIKLSSISAVKLNNNRTFLRYAGPFLVIAGTVLFVIDAVNQSVVQTGGYEFSPGVAIASTSLISVGTIFTFAGRNKIKIKKWWRLRIVQI